METINVSQRNLAPKGVDMDMYSYRRRYAQKLSCSKLFSAGLLERYRAYIRALPGSRVDSEAAQQPFS